MGVHLLLAILLADHIAHISRERRLVPVMHALLSNWLVGYLGFRLVGDPLEAEA